MKVVIDAGHGPETAGKRSPDGVLREYMFNSVTARYVIELLQQYEGVETLATFEDSRDVPLKERTDKANAWRADLFISIHANAMGGDWGTANGIETFCYLYTDPPTDHFAETLHRHMIQATGRFDRGLKRADFHVIRETHMPAILIECGFMDNHEECTLLYSDEYRRTCAAAIVAALVELYNLKPKKGEEYEMSPEDANKIIGFLSAAYTAVDDPEAHAEFKRLANELRKTSGQAEV